MKIIKLYFESPVHFGEKRLSESKITFSADTLFSALMIEAVGLGKEDEFYQLASNNLKTACQARNLGIFLTFPFATPAINFHFS